MTTMGYIWGLIILIGIFFAIRDIICWYFKINKLAEQQKQIIDLLQAIVGSKATTTSDDYWK